MAMLTREMVQAIFEEEYGRKLTLFQYGYLAYFSIMAVFLLVMSVIKLGEGASFAWGLGLMGLIHAGVFIAALRDAQNSRACAQLLLDALAADGGKLVWVYRCDEITPNGSAQSVAFVYGFANGRRASFANKPVLIDALLTYFSAAYPSISVGYSKALDKTFKRTPQQLREAPQRNGAIQHVEVDHSQANGW